MIKRKSLMATLVLFYFIQNAHLFSIVLIHNGDKIDS